MSEHELWNELGNLYYLSGSYNQAIYAYNRSIQMESRFGRPYSNLALAYVQQGKYADAVKLYQAGIELLPDNKEKAISWYRLGDVYRCMKDYRDAILAYQQGDLLNPNLSQDSEELGEVLYGPSGLTSAPALSEIEATEMAQPPATASASDSPGPGEASPGSVGPSPAPTVEPEPATAEEVALAMEESEADLVSESPVPQQEAKEALPAIDEQSVPEFEGEFFSGLFEQEPVEEMEEEAPNDWLFYFGSKVPDPTVTQASSHEFAAQEPIALTSVLNPEPAMLNSRAFSPRLARETQLDAMLRADFQSVTVVEREEPLSLILATPSAQKQGVAVAQEASAFQDVGSMEDVAALEEAVELQVAVEAEDATAVVDSKQEAFTEQPTAEANETDLEIEKIKRELDADPNNAIAWQSLGDLQKSAKMYEDAIYSYQQAVSKDPKNVDHRYRLGMGYAIEGRVEESVRTFQEILMLNPNYGLAHATLSGFYQRMGFDDLAKKHINIAMQRIYEGENEYNRACLQALCGNVDEALGLLKIALENKQTFVDWAFRDPDLDNLRSDPRFHQLISDFS